jgi:hypothetical protein
VGGFAESFSNRYSVRPSGPTTTGPSEVCSTLRLIARAAGALVAGLPATCLPAAGPPVAVGLLAAAGDPDPATMVVRPAADANATRNTTPPAQISGTRYERSFTGSSRGQKPGEPEVARV